jgi:hypothetical protein
MHTDQEFTPEWAREALKTLDYKPRRPLGEYLSGPDLITAKLALKVLAVNANPKMSKRSPRYAVHEAGGRIRIKVFLSPVAPVVSGLRRI